MLFLFQAGLHLKGQASFSENALKKSPGLLLLSFTISFFPKAHFQLYLLHGR